MKDKDTHLLTEAYIKVTEMARQDQLGKGNTTVKTENGTTTITFHATDIVKFSSEAIQLDSGGWLTATTKTRMNQASNQFDLGYSVFQKGGAWFVKTKSGTIPFEDKMVIPNGGYER